MDEPAASLAENAGKWYRENGHPWTCSRLAALQGIEEDTLLLDDGTLLSSRVLAEGARRSGTHSISIIAVSAGVEVDGVIRQVRWIQLELEPNRWFQRANWNFLHLLAPSFSGIG